MSDRPSQIAAEIRRALQSELSRGLNDPRVQGLVSVTEVDLSPDFSSATVQISVLPEDRAPLTLSGLRAAAGFLRRRVSDATRIPRVPRICFELDTRLKRQAALDAAIRGGASAESIALDPASTTDAVQRGRTAVRGEDVSGEDSGLGETSSENSRDEG